MVILTPTEIDELLINRLTKTIDLYKKLDTTETEIYNTIYFKLYFDVSTAIENTISNILYIKYGNDDFIYQKSKIGSESVSKYLPKDEIKLLVQTFGDTITVAEIQNHFVILKDIVKDSFYRNLGIEKRLYEVEDFNSFYTQSRDIRNKLAHGLTLTNVDFSAKMLFKFLASYYVLKKLHEQVAN